MLGVPWSVEPVVIFCVLRQTFGFPYATSNLRGFEAMEAPFEEMGIVIVQPREI